MIGLKSSDFVFRISLLLLVGSMDPAKVSPFFGLGGEEGRGVQFVVGTARCLPLHVQ